MDDIHLEQNQPMESFIPERSNIAKSAKSIFFEDFNDIDLYIEDTTVGYSKLFSIMFSRLFEGIYRIERVFPVGDRDSVISQHKQHENNGRPSLYIIDGDLYILTGNDAANQPGLFKLPVYCIENILCDHEAIIDVLDEEDPVYERTKIAESFDYEEWLSNNCDLLFDLFIEYTISFHANRTIKTVSFPVRKLVESERGNVSREKIANRIEEIKTESIRILGDHQYQSTRQDLIERFTNNNKEKLKIVSGKDYLFPLLKMRAKSVVETKIPDINLKQRIAKRCDLGDLIKAKDYVLR